MPYFKAHQFWSILTRMSTKALWPVFSNVPKKLWQGGSSLNSVLKFVTLSIKRSYGHHLGQQLLDSESSLKTILKTRQALDVLRLQAGLVPGEAVVPGGVSTSPLHSQGRPGLYSAELPLLLSIKALPAHKDGFPCPAQSAPSKTIRHPRDSCS